MASRPSSITGPARRRAHEPVVARVTMVVPPARAMAAAANDNHRGSVRGLLGTVGCALALALALGLYVYFS